MHPIKDATLKKGLDNGKVSISIHAPYKGCNMDQQSYLDLLKISIHAPYKGCNGIAVSWCGFTSRFQSMHPIKDATLEKDGVRPLQKFQSMHPIKDATNQIAFFVF